MAVADADYCAWRAPHLGRPHEGARLALCCAVAAGGHALPLSASTTAVERLPTLQCDTLPLPQIPTDAPEWSHVYAQPDRPLVLDLGCGYGRFLLALT